MSLSSIGGKLSRYGGTSFVLAGNLAGTAGNSAASACTYVALAGNSAASARTSLTIAELSGTAIEMSSPRVMLRRENPGLGGRSPILQKLHFFPKEFDRRSFSLTKWQSSSLDFLHSCQLNRQQSSQTPPLLDWTDLECLGKRSRSLPALAHGEIL